MRMPRINVYQSATTCDRFADTRCKPSRLLMDDASRATAARPASACALIPRKQAFIGATVDQKRAFQPMRCLIVDPQNAPFCDGQHSRTGRVRLSWRLSRKLRTPGEIRDGFWNG